MSKSAASFLLCVPTANASSQDLAHLDGPRFKGCFFRTDAKFTITVFVIYRYREFAPQEYEKRNLIQLPEDDYQAYEPQVPAYQDPNQILFKRSKLLILCDF